MTYSRQKSYAKNIKRDLEFRLREWVYLKISPMKGVIRFYKKGKLCPRYVLSCEILKRVGKWENELELPIELALVHLVFHVSILNK